MSECNNNCNTCNENCDERQNCSGSCSSCSQDCSSRVEIKPTADTKINKIIGVLSGKGGVGKSMVSALLAVELAQAGYKVGIMDSDITGPSIPKMFGLNNPLYGDEEGVFPAVTTLGIKVVSINNMLENEDDAVLWRGPILGGMIRQFYTEVHWGELDYFLIDLPPGTSDIHLTLISELQLTGVIVVTTPQPVALVDARKGVEMFRNEKVNVPILGLIENMAWFTPSELPENKYYIFGKDGGKKLAEELNIPLLGQIPLVQSIREGGDEGTPIALQAGHPAAIEFDKMASQLVD